MSLRFALDEYTATRQRHLRASTLSYYQREIDRLLGWAADRELVAATDLGRAQLAAYGRWLARTSPSSRTLNDRLRRLRAILSWLRRNELLPSLTGDDVRDGLRGEPGEPRALPTYLRREALRELVLRMLHAGGEVLDSVVLYLLSGVRLSEGLLLTQDRVHLEAESPEIAIPYDNRTKPGRAIHLEVSPALQDLLASRRDRRAYVLSGRKPLSRDQGRRLMVAVHRAGAPAGLTWRLLRHTCATYLTCAPGIYGAASAYMSARQLGHSVAVAQRHYLGLVRGIPREATTLEEAMGIHDLLDNAPWARRRRA